MKIYLQALETSAKGTLGRQDTMQEVEEVWREDHLKEEHREDEFEKNDYEIEQLGRESEEKKVNIYDAPDSEDSFNNITDDVLPQYVEEQKNDHLINLSSKSSSPFSSPELSDRLVKLWVIIVVSH